jgi:phosphopantetheinyl transferase
MGGAGKLGRHKLTRNEKGKPLLVDEEGREEKSVSFNISHQVK